MDIETPLSDNGEEFFYEFGNFARKLCFLAQLKKFFLVMDEIPCYHAIMSMNAGMACSIRRRKNKTDGGLCRRTAIGG